MALDTAERPSAHDRRRQSRPPADFPGEGAQAALHPVANHRAADLLGHGKTNANGIVAIAAVENEEDKARAGSAPAAIRGEEIGAFTKGD